MPEDTMSSTQPTFLIEDLHVSVEDKEILRGVNLAVKQGEIHDAVSPYDFGFELFGIPIRSTKNNHLVGIGDDVVIGQNVPFVVY